MKILFLTDGIYPFQIGGMQKHSTILSGLLAKEGCNVDVVHCGGDKYSGEEFLKVYSEVGSSNVREWFLPFPKTDILPGHYVRENKHYSKNAYLLVKDKLEYYDVIYSQGFTAWHFLKEKEKGAFKAPVFVNFHGFEMFQKPPSLRVQAEFQLLRKSVKWIIRHADYVYSFGGQISRIIESLDVEKSKILLQSNGIRSEWIKAGFKPTGEGREFLFIGRYERRKGIEELNKALKRILSDPHVDFRFHFVGPIPANKRIKDKRIKYHGEVRDADKMKEHIDACDILVCPSHSEGMPTVILEAMSRGLAIIATDVGAVERQIDGNGILLEGPDVRKIADSIKDLIGREYQEIDQMKSRSQELVKEQFTWEVITNQKIEDFKKALN